MKKLFSILLILSVISISLCNTGCEINSSAPPPEFITPDVIESYKELDEIIAFISDNFIMSVRVKIRDFNVWVQLDEHYEENAEILVLRGIKGMEIRYSDKGKYFDVEIIMEYEMFMSVIVAYETNDKSFLTKEESMVYDKALSITSKILSDNSSIFDKAHAIHTYLVDNIEYEYNYAEKENAFNVYGALIEGMAVCEAYTQAYKMLLHLMGVESLIVTGTASGDDHAWNLVNYGNEWYHTDVTWNDQNEFASHKYFNTTDEVMSVTHTWDTSAYPNVYSTRYNYFRYKGVMASSPDTLEAAFFDYYNSLNNPNTDVFYEILCTFSVTTDDLNFLSNYTDGDIYRYSIEDYGNDILLTILL